jgi:hypothetical protein
MGGQFPPGTDNNLLDLVLGHDGEGDGGGDNHSRLTGTLDPSTKQNTNWQLSPFFFVFF